MGFKVVQPIYEPKTNPGQKTVTKITKTCKISEPGIHIKTNRLLLFKLQKPVQK